MVNDLPHDEMHLLDLGCMKKVLLFTGSGKFTPARISKRSVQELSYRLEYLRPYVPIEMARKPRGLNELARWKATEFHLHSIKCLVVTKKHTLQQAIKRMNETDRNAISKTEEETTKKAT